MITGSGGIFVCSVGLRLLSLVHLLFFISQSDCSRSYLFHFGILSPRSTSSFLQPSLYTTIGMISAAIPCRQTPNWKTPTRKTNIGLQNHHHSQQRSRQKTYPRSQAASEKRKKSFTRRPHRRTQSGDQRMDKILQSGGLQQDLCYL
jgi:hypothetical protein